MHFGAAHGPPCGPDAEGGEVDGRGRKPDAEGGEADGRGLAPVRRPFERTAGVLQFSQNEMANLRQTQRKLKIARRETSS